MTTCRGSNCTRSPRSNGCKSALPHPPQDSATSAPGLGRIRPRTRPHPPQDSATSAPGPSHVRLFVGSCTCMLVFCCCCSADPSLGLAVLADEDLQITTALETAVHDAGACECCIQHAARNIRQACGPATSEKRPLYTAAQRCLPRPPHTARVHWLSWRTQRRCRNKPGWWRSTRHSARATCPPARFRPP